MADDTAAATTKTDDVKPGVTTTIPVDTPVKATRISGNDGDDKKEKQAAIDASNASLKDYDPAKVKDSEKVAELVDHASKKIKDLVEHANSVVASSARDVMAEMHPGGKNFPNGPSKGSK